MERTHCLSQLGGQGHPPIARPGLGVPSPPDDDPVGHDDRHQPDSPEQHPQRHLQHGRGFRPPRQRRPRRRQEARPEEPQPDPFLSGGLAECGCRGRAAVAPPPPPAQTPPQEAGRRCGGPGRGQHIDEIVYIANQRQFDEVSQIAFNQVSSLSAACLRLF